MTDTSLHVERTLALIKPDVVHLAEEIEDVILRSGFTILQVGDRSYRICYLSATSARNVLDVYTFNFPIHMIVFIAIWPCIFDILTRGGSCS